MATTHPHLALLFDNELNNGLTTETVIATTNQKLWWRCRAGDDHIWEKSGAQTVKYMESKLVDGLFFAGEVIDVDGITGGFNFQNAWTNGFHAGTEIASR